jgi:hypothetical protein
MMQILRNYLLFNLKRQNFRQSFHRKYFKNHNIDPKISWQQVFSNLVPEKWFCLKLNVLYIGGKKYEIVN